MDRAAKSPSLSALSRPWNISSLPRMKEMEKESEREGGKNEGCVCEREKQRKKRNKIAFTVQAASEIIFHISATAWAQWEREYDFLHTVPMEKKNLSQNKREECWEENERALAGLYIRIPVQGLLLAGLFWLENTQTIIQSSFQNPFGPSSSPPRSIKLRPLPPARHAGSIQRAEELDSMLIPTTLLSCSALALRVGKRLLLSPRFWTPSCH